MVVGGANMVVPAAPGPCPMTPVLQQYSPRLCPVSPVTTVSYQARFPTATIVPNGQIVPVSSHVTAYGHNFPSPPYSGQTVTTAVLPSPITPLSIPYNPSMPPQSAMIPYTPCTVTCSPGKGSNTTVYNGMTTVVPANHSNNTSVIACGPRIYTQGNYSPGLCTIGAHLWPGAVCPAMPTSVLANDTRICQISPNTLAVPTFKQSYGMEQVWQLEFKKLFFQYSPHLWILHPVNQSPVAGIWKTYVDSAKVRFCCEDCGHGWTSMKGRVAFWFFLDSSVGEGIVCFKLYGQQCDRCKTGNYEPVMWYPEEVFKVLVNIYNKVGQVYYGFQQAPCFRTRRPGKPRTPHNAELCQACKDGVCSERR